MGAKYFLDERNLQALGLNEPNIRTLRALTDFLNVRTTVGAIQDAGTGLIAKTSTDAFAGRTLQAPAAGITIANPGGIAGDPTFALANDLAAVEGLSGTGIIVRTATDTWDERTLQAPAAGFSITNPAGIAGDPTFVLANDLAALEALTGTNTIYYRSAADTWSAVVIGTGLSFAAGTLATTGVAASGPITASGLTMSASRILGRTTAGTGAVEELTLSQTLDLVGSAAQGDILYRGASDWARLAAGTSGQVLTTNGAGANPSWGAGTSEASNAEIWTGSEAAKFISPRRFYTAEEPQSATSSATITLNGTNGLNFDITLDTNANLANPTNFQTGRAGMVRITQDGTGSRTMTFGSNWRFPGGTPTLSSAPGAIDVITFFVWSASMIIATIENDYSAGTGTGNLLLGGDMQDVFGDSLLLGGDMTDGDDVLRVQET